MRVNDFGAYHRLLAASPAPTVDNFARTSSASRSRTTDASNVQSTSTTSIVLQWAARRPWEAVDSDAYLVTDDKAADVVAHRHADVGEIGRMRAYLDELKHDRRSDRPSAQSSFPATHDMRSLALSPTTPHLVAAVAGAAAWRGSEPVEALA